LGMSEGTAHADIISLSSVIWVYMKNNYRGLAMPKGSLCHGPQPCLQQALYFFLVDSYLRSVTSCDYHLVTS
jgi:hypothetical protein